MIPERESSASKPRVSRSHPPLSRFLFRPPKASFVLFVALPRGYFFVESHDNLDLRLSTPQVPFSRLCQSHHVKSMADVAQEAAPR